MAIKWDNDANRYFIKLTPNSKKIYINDGRSKKFKPSKAYIKALEKQLKTKSKIKEKIEKLKKNTKTKQKLQQDMKDIDKTIFSIINDKTVSTTDVGALLSKYDFTEVEKFNKLYNASINFVKHWKSKMIFEIQNVRNSLNESVYELELVPKKLPEHNDPLDILKDYFNTAMRTYIKFLGKENKKPRDFKFIIEVNNLNDRTKDGKFGVSYVLTDWNKASLNEVLDRIESFIVSAHIISLNSISLSIKSYNVIAGGVVSKELSDDIYSKRSIIKITNDGNSCFWWSLILLIYQNTETYKKIKDLRYTNTLNIMAKQLCVSCGYDYSKMFLSDDIPDIITKICSAGVGNKKNMFNIVILDIDNLPAFNTTTNNVSNKVCVIRMFLFIL